MKRSSRPHSDAERRVRYAQRDERNILQALSSSRFFSAGDIRRGMRRSIPNRDLAEALKRLHRDGCILKGPLPNGKHGWRLTAIGKERIAQQD